MSVFDFSEADEAAIGNMTALYNLECVIASDETEGIIAMYERAAWNVGASVQETEALFRRRK